MLLGAVGIEGDDVASQRGARGILEQLLSACVCRGRAHLSYRRVGIVSAGYGASVNIQ
jgi:hypothetical protein